MLVALRQNDFDSMMQITFVKLGLLKILYNSKRKNFEKV